ncbi:hypothetical protein [Bdellovibrio sp. HCB337]|uniref:hypothetical protein n=1 Tax=Bdellovibrio sp. HCB337 TaxID=3394358 RepID=UPI0039A5F8D4
MKFVTLIFISILAATAVAAEEPAVELANIIKCHEALDGKSEGQTQKLTYEASTPIVLSHGKNLFFTTDTSIYVLENKYQGKSLLIHLKNNDKDFYREMAVGKNGRIGLVSYDEVLETKEAVDPTPSLDSESLLLLKKDILHRVDSMTTEYQNKFDPKDTMDALKICESIQFPGLQKSIEKQNAYYEALLKNPSAYFNGLKKKRRSADINSQ